MGRFILFLAFLLLAVSIVLLIILVQGADNVWAKQAFETAVCEKNETLVQWLGNYVRSTSTSSGGRETAFYCEDKEGQQRDVTGSVVLMMIGGFVIPFLLSLILFFVGAGVMVSNRMKTATKNVFDLSGGSPVWNAVNNQQLKVIDLRDGSYQGGAIPPEKLAQVQQIMKQFGFSDFATGLAGHSGSLTEHLKQVEDAHKQGLITQSEYEHLRQTILDHVD